MIKRSFIFVFVLLLILAGMGFIKYQQIQEGMAAMASSAPPPAAVETTVAQTLQWQPRISAVGTLTAREGIDIRNEVEGVVEKIHIESGQSVNKGDMLASLNDDVELADLASFMAQEELAISVFERNQRMWAKKTISETDYDNASSNLKIAKANVKQTEARIAKKALRAPFDGVLGIKHVNTGQYVAPGTMLVSLQDYSLLYIDFSVPEKYLPDIKSGQQVEVRVSAYPESMFTGSVQAIDVVVDETTRNINVRAQLPNDENLLRPGMYAEISLILDKPTDRIVVPATSIVFSSFGDALFVVQKNDEGADIAQRVQVTTGEQRGDLVVIAEGLKGGEQVVQAGVNKLRNQMPVTVSEQQRLMQAE
ncbi:efflux RND transporter periplasmic adaptor subunit [Solemya velum gill symbiont]|uniref:Multidrug efflux pump AcrAB, subunit A1 n=2 Tax=Solemya velum gill symbiont TaxID=2340 RepID=A0A0B0HAW9_SOVGS|nr:efflux RND transporter periplasmic adaptor subunit [Solemya velum gill symbiont]KHF25009.1 multidrug efflux pump AcrAB, subunit A1 [Solemya velum gill symbiont]OOY34282.1 hypothetical protein BOV88_10975 [Solemya velum gill symbiont]OOY37055.1 hypothetical protein BOV89_09545 [Solemya velum gill symbiont]OOY44763.1 hypothetical protein BOV91_00375 [Solemya velum gill symbiont]OOY47377.1 hypothetical protein BOV93_07015 [Solemya velum gill symbiont]